MEMLQQQFRPKVRCTINWVTAQPAVAWVYELRLLASLRNYYLPSKSRVSLNTVPQPYGALQLRSPPSVVVP